MPQEPCHLERLGAPPWTCAAGAALLAALVGCGVAFLTAVLPGHAPSWRLLRVWMVGIPAAAVALRPALRAYREHRKSRRGRRA